METNTNTVATQQNKQTTAKGLLSQENVRIKFEEMLGKKSQGFITSVLQIVANNSKLSMADPISVYNVAMIAATLDLPLNDNLGFAYIIPYTLKQQDGSYKQVAQFQLGYKGFIQLAQRSGAFKTLSATPIYEGQLTKCNPLEGFEFDFTKKESETIIGFASYFKLLNGFEKTLYMSISEMKAHGLKYSKTFNNSYGLWNTDLAGMGSKTVIKLLLSKFAPLSIEMQTAVKVDQALINDEKGDSVTYIDHEDVVVNKEEERALQMVADCMTLEDLDMLKISCPEINTEVIGAKKLELQNKKGKK